MILLLMVTQLYHATAPTREVRTEVVSLRSHVPDDFMC